MNETIIYLIIAILALGIGFVIGKLFSKGSLESLKTSLEGNQKLLEDTKNDSSRTINQLKQEAKDIQTEKEDILRVNIRQDEAIKSLKEKIGLSKKKKLKGFRKNLPRNLRILPIKY